MVNVGGVVSVGGFGGSGGSGGSNSGIQTFNGLVGPDVTLVGTSGVQVAPVSASTINIGVDAIGVNGISVSIVDNQLVIDGVGASGAGGGVTKFAATFSNITSGIFTHSLGTLDVVVQVRDNASGGGRVLIPDFIVIENLDQVSLVFNRPQSGRVVIV
jgi:hypothetical protein